MVSHDGIHIGEVKDPELLHDFSCGSGWGKKQHLDSIYVAEPEHVFGRRNDHQDYKVSINRP